MLKQAQLCSTNLELRGVVASYHLEVKSQQEEAAGRGFIHIDSTSYSPGLSGKASIKLILPDNPCERAADPLCLIRGSAVNSDYHQLS